VLAGANFIHQAAGWLEGGLTIGYEKFVMDVERCGALHRTLAGLTIDDDGLAADAYREAGPGTAFLGTAHTMANFAAANHPLPLADTNSFEQWDEHGGLDQRQRAHGVWQAVLATVETPPLDPGVDTDLQAFVAERKDAMPDMWY
jgi:trimethylamine--corrinoid protein Co-methyltransferase